MGESYDLPEVDHLTTGAIGPPGERAVRRAPRCRRTCVRPPERPQADHLNVLRQGELELEGRMPWSSNGTYLVRVCHEGQESRAVYKPVHGERPLWDFPPGLYL